MQQSAPARAVMMDFGSRPCRIPPEAAENQTAKIVQTPDMERAIVRTLSCLDEPAQHNHEK